MTWIDKLILAYSPWLVVGILILTFYWLTKWAKNKKTGAVIFAAMIHMFLPDPFSERTVEVVQQERKADDKEQDSDEKLYLDVGKSGLKQTDNTQN